MLREVWGFIKGTIFGYEVALALVILGFLHSRDTDRASKEKRMPPYHQYRKERKGKETDEVEIGFH